jgi:hypothetical protein
VPSYVPHYKPGDDPTIVLAGTVVGGNLVTTGGVVAGANATDWLGVASDDGVAGQRQKIWCGAIQDLVCSGTIAAGVPVKCAAAGQIALWVTGTDGAEKMIGTTLAAGTVGVAVPVKMIR